MKQYIADTCEITCEDNNKKLTVDILDFKEKKSLSVSLNKSLKLVMPWNGKIYEGRMSGMSFVSNGPVIREVKEGR